jgi:hypothetical protein
MNWVVNPVDGGFGAYPKFDPDGLRGAVVRRRET